MKDLFQSQLVSGGLLLMLSGAAMALLRKLPEELMQWLKRQFSVTLIVYNEEPIFDWLVVWLDKQPYSQRARRLTVRAIRDEGDHKDESRMLFSPSVGAHCFRYKGHLLWLNRDREKSDTPNALSGVSVKHETISITMLGRSQDALREILVDARAAMHDEKTKRVSVFVGDYWSWRRVQGAKKRPYSSVVLPMNQSHALLEDVRWFLFARSEYDESHVPYRRGYLLHGSAGSGKTSLVAAIASELNLNLYVLPLSSNDMDDSKLFNLMTTLRPGSVVLLEDVDAAQLRRPDAEPDDSQSGKVDGTPEKKSAGVSLSALLNSIDGIAAPEGCLTFMTTNFVEKIDPALIRPGRIDVRIEFTNADESQMRALYGQFFPNSNGDAEQFIARFSGQGVVMAQVQEELMRLKFRQKSVQ